MKLTKAKENAQYTWKRRFLYQQLEQFNTRQRARVRSTKDYRRASTKHDYNPNIRFLSNIPADKRLNSSEIPSPAKN